MRTMQPLKSAILVIFFLLISSSNVFALLYDFEWSFDDPDQIVGPEEAVIMNATLTNTGTQNLLRYGWDYSGTEANYGVNGFGISWGNFKPNDTGYAFTSLFTTENLNLAPGESWHFEFGRFTPPAVGVEAGIYSINWAYFNLTNYVAPDGSVSDIQIYGGPFTATVNDNPGVAPVPEPATMLLFGTGLVGLVGSRLRKKKK